VQGYFWYSRVKVKMKAKCIALADYFSCPNWTRILIVNKSHSVYCQTYFVTDLSEVASRLLYININIIQST